MKKERKHHLVNNKKKGITMHILIKQIEVIERIDQLIRLQATGTPEALAYRLGISKTKLYRIINIMKDLNAPILYDVTVQSFVYQEAVGFQFGFYEKQTSTRGVNPFVG